MMKRACLIPPLIVFYTLMLLLLVEKGISASLLQTFTSPWTSPYRVDPLYPHQLVNQEGQYLFIVNKTAWAYFGCQNPQGVIDRAKAQGVDVLRVALEGVPYPDELDIEMWPWGGTREEPDWNSLNESYWSEVENRIQRAGEQGVGFDVVLYLNLHPTVDQIDQQKLYWQTILSRLSRYSNILTWEIQNEYIENEEFQDVVGLYLKENDPYRHPVCTSDGTTDGAIWPHKPWMDLAIVHTCTGSTDDYDLKDWYLSIARNTRSHGKPAFNNESGREKRHGNNDGVHRRKQGWLWCTAGGFWTWHSWDGCEGIDSEGYQAPGAEYLKPLADFFLTIPFWQMDPNFTACTLSDSSLVWATLADTKRENIITYGCIRKSGESRNEVKAKVRLPDGSYQITFINPGNLKQIDEMSYISKGLNQVETISLPSFTDDLLVQIRKADVLERNVIPGTE